MATKERIDFCIECRREVEFILKKKVITKVIKEKEYEFSITVAECSECGEEISIPGLMDKNIKEIDEQYRKIEGLVAIEDIEKMMKLYNIGKAPLSLALGFGEITITRYLAGQMPSKEYSDIMKAALTSPRYMRERLFENRSKIADAAFNKSMKAIDELERMFEISDKLIGVISYIFWKMEEVTPLMLQKILYYIQGISYALIEKPMFIEECQAWIHGPVYPSVYDLFRDFRYNPIEDPRFALFHGGEQLLSNEEKAIVNLVVNTFGLYGGKTLERITHNEHPWKMAREGVDDTIPSNITISKENIMAYFKLIHSKFDISSERGLNAYIAYMLQ